MRLKNTLNQLETELNSLESINYFYFILLNNYKKNNVT